jgi:Tol biopolymer transport system component
MEGSSNVVECLRSDRLSSKLHELQVFQPKNGLVSALTLLLWVILSIPACTAEQSNSEPSSISTPTVSGRILFLSSGGDSVGLYNFYIDLAEPEIVKRGVGPEFDPFAELSPDGLRVAHAEGSSLFGGCDIVVVTLGPSSEERLTDSPGCDAAPAWSPDGQKIVFYSERDGNLEIYVMNDDGSSQERLTDNPSLDGAPAWSPDGSIIAFVSDRDGNAEIFVMAANGTGQTNISNSPAEDTLPVWSPDGGQIAFQSDRDGNSEIYVISADGNELKNLTNCACDDQLGDWSPDGNWITFYSDRDGIQRVFCLRSPQAKQSN